MGGTLFETGPHSKWSGLAQSYHRESSTLHTARQRGPENHEFQTSRKKLLQNVVTSFHIADQITNQD